ncbi:hypothetical protein ERJ75_000335200 [Trypanosoma vivax]|nr:hypothetical protein ERJ75_000335200 [Trypanosoma vivax]
MTMGCSARILCTVILLIPCTGAATGALQRSAVSCQLPASNGTDGDPLFAKAEGVACKLGTHVGKARIIFDTFKGLASAAKNWDYGQNATAIEIIDAAEKAAEEAQRTVRHCAESTVPSIFTYNGYSHRHREFHLLRNAFGKCKSKEEQIVSPHGSLGTIRRPIFEQVGEIKDLWQVTQRSINATYREVVELRGQFYLCQLNFSTQGHWKYVDYYNFMNLVEAEFRATLLKLGGVAASRAVVGATAEESMSKLMSVLKDEEEKRLMEASEPINELVEGRSRAKSLCGVVGKINELNSTVRRIDAIVGEVLLRNGEVKTAQNEISQLVREARRHVQRTNALSDRAVAKGAYAEMAERELSVTDPAVVESVPVESVRVARDAVNRSQRAVREGLEARGATVHALAIIDDSERRLLQSTRVAQQVEAKVRSIEAEARAVSGLLKQAEEVVVQEITAVSSGIETNKRKLLEIQKKFPITVAELDGRNDVSVCAGVVVGGEATISVKKQIQHVNGTEAVENTLSALQSRAESAVETAHDQKSVITKALSDAQATRVQVHAAKEAVYKAEKEASAALAQVRIARAAVQRVLKETSEARRRSTHCVPLYDQLLQRIVGTS